MAFSPGTEKLVSLLLEGCWEIIRDRTFLLFMVRWSEGACCFLFNHSSLVATQYSPCRIKDASRVSADDAIITFSQQKTCQCGEMYCVEVTRESQALTSSRDKRRQEEGKNFDRFMVMAIVSSVALM